MKKRILGFTLIELLIVITIIGILAVVFIPTVMNAPAKARDASRQAAVNNILKGIEAGRLDGSAKDTDITTGCAPAVLGKFKNFMGGGQIPSDPQFGKADIGPNTECPTDILVVKYDTTDQPISYGVFAKLENGNGNVDCADSLSTKVPTLTTATDNYCYGALSQ